MRENRIKELLVATRNRGKIAELEVILAGWPVSLQSLAQFPHLPDVAETATTIDGNARLKAHDYAQATGLWAIADDSGLEVAALNGAPGVYSARFGGAGLSDTGRVQLLLEKLAAVPDAARQARFVCTIAIADPSGGIAFAATGLCPGQIIRAPRGTNGFGYDPVFMPEGYEQTFAELAPEIKNTISHRARALQQVKEWLNRANS